jgi:hypothetical protein
MTAYRAILLVEDNQLEAMAKAFKWTWLEFGLAI